MNTWEQAEGSPFPLGASWNADASTFNFSLYSRHATSVHLLLYRRDELDAPAHEIALDYLHNKSGPVWHCRVQCEAENEWAYYGYRVDGPAPQPGYDFHDFDFQKILLDPFAKGVFFPPGFRETLRDDLVPTPGKHLWESCPISLVNSIGKTTHCCTMAATW
ncbi:hypothetical protein [Rhodopirellula bahusiensis]|uniref:hypothetical protein n=1 Tax=Rhodopirellula bahusiensis TaxID=2014065 RepID=UPI001E2B3EBF|nr:hypothetical protein [Rhodopirellula bahusiensis]